MQPVYLLYDGLLKHEATALFLLHTEVLGLNAWLVSVEVPGIDKHCTCRWPVQTMCHILLFCSNHTDSHALYFQRAGLTDLHGALFMVASAHQAAKWLATSDLLSHFSLAQQITQEDTSGYGGLAYLNA